jgi:hypothetical protein
LLLTFGRSDANTLEQVRIDKGKLNDLTKLSDLLSETTDLGIRNVSWIFVAHLVNERVDFPRQLAHDCKRSHVKRNTSALKM